MRLKPLVLQSRGCRPTNRISSSSFPQRIPQGVGRNSLRKSRVVKLKKIRGAVLPAFTRLARLHSVKNLQDLIDWDAFTVIQNTWRYIREEHINFLIEASPSDRNRIQNDIKEFLPKINITDVKKVNNPFLEALYGITKIEYEKKYGTDVKEKELYHSTKAGAVPTIVENNLDWRMVFRSRFGRGTCFSNDADYGDCHSNRGNGNSRAFIICKVLVGKKVLGSQSLPVPPPGYDTTTGGKTREIVYVKFKDNEFLPIFVVFYNGSDPYSSRYNRMPNNFFK